jgi:hypothetical protein
MTERPSASCRGACGKRLSLIRYGLAVAKQSGLSARRGERLYNARSARNYCGVW